jgi:hypothetical protein
MGELMVSTALSYVSLRVTMQAHPDLFEELIDEVLLSFERSEGRLEQHAPAVAYARRRLEAFLGAARKIPRPDPARRSAWRPFRRRSEP